MNVVVDANIVIAALLGSRATLAILSSQNYNLYVPRKIIEEIKENTKTLSARNLARIQKSSTLILKAF